MGLKDSGSVSEKTFGKRKNEEIGIQEGKLGYEQVVEKPAVSGLALGV